jgi:flagellin
MQIQVEVSALVSEVDRIASAAQFNGMNMLTGRFARPTGENVVTGSMWFHIGSNMDQRMQVFIGTMSATALGIREMGSEEKLTLATPEDANRAIGTIDEALKKINKQRADLGAYQNRIEYTVKGLNIAAENLQASDQYMVDDFKSLAINEINRLEEFGNLSLNPTETIELIEHIKTAFHLNEFALSEEMESFEWDESNYE